MQNQKVLKADYNNLLALRALTETYEDVAIAKMQEIRGEVIGTRNFLFGVSEIFTLAKSAYLSQIVDISDKGARQAEIDFMHKNRKMAIVFISGNHSLLGNIVFQAYKVFLDLSHKVNADLVIMGDIGRYLASGERPSLTFTYFPFDDFVLTDAQIKPVISHIANYEKVYVVYPRFKSVLVQIPQVDDVTGGVKIEQASKGVKKYLFEPSAKEVMRYFEDQIVGTLFKQKVLESMLAKYASRLTIMDEATITIDKYIENNKKAELISKKKEDNRRLMQSFAGISLWR